ncbi:MAG: NADH-quinone oxidoreductase subunit L, partial [Deltaproteobacteria bacterium]|nr:NADH-quinone oxidoreductase subunit L [Deltaproteobacteria bacterium]
YLLIGFWYEDMDKAKAGKKAFVVNRIGDFGFLLGIFTLIALFGTTQINNFAGAQGLLGVGRGIAPDALGATVPSGVMGTLQLTWGQGITLACLLLFVGATGKSAQVPLYVWLPDAMAGPTPVSALIHAATMVTAGVYVVARMSLFFALSPTAMAVVTCVGAFTALFAALMGFAQNDIKKVLAYSTVSQLGFMMIGVGIGAFWQAIFHLVTHAFFKALLFLGAGSVILGCHHEQDIRAMGGLRQRMSTTGFTFLIGTLAITGVAPLSGFFSKDLLLHFAHEAKIAGFAWVGPTVYAVGTLAALGTAFYMFRLYFLVFAGEPRSEKAAHAEESGGAIKFALWVLALGSVVGLVWGLPLVAARSGYQVVFDNFTQAVFGVAQARLGTEASTFAGASWYSALAPFLQVNLSGFLVALGVAWLGLGIAFWLYLRGGIVPVGRVLRPGNAVYDAFAHKFYVDEIYDALVVWPLNRLANLLHVVVDQALIETVAIRGTTMVTQSAGRLLRLLQNGDAQRYAAVIAVAVVAIVWALT